MNSIDAFTFGLNAKSATPKAQSCATTSEHTNDHSLRKCVERAMEEYFSHLDGQDCSDLYQLVLQEVEEPLLTVVMKHTQNNQSKATALLGLNRGTLRKKLKRYDLL